MIALLSVSDKTGLVEFARGLTRQGFELVASGGTAAALEAAGLEVAHVEQYTGAPEILQGRVKTLHPRIHAGILADRRRAEHLAELDKHGHQPIDLVVCNLYPFRETLRAGGDREALVEKIDIGGPTLVRAAAKNADGGVAIVVDPADYGRVIESLGAEGVMPLSLRRSLAAKAFRHVAEYDLAIASWAESQVSAEPLPALWNGLSRKHPLRYGENPHQAGALYVSAVESGGVANGRLLSGKELSYTNYLDMDAALRAACAFEGTCCAVVKHTNPCGLATAATQREAFRSALAGDPVSAFGGVLGFNAPVEADTVESIREAKLFVECIVAPGFAPAALGDLRRRENLRVFQVDDPRPPVLNAHRVGGGMLVEETDTAVEDAADWTVVTKRLPEEGWIDELRFAMKACALLKSNAIAVTRERRLLGIGTGQTSRVDAVGHALAKAGNAAREAFLASDAFFPFDDSVKLAAAAGIAAIVQPGGSKRDRESIDACDAAGIAMVFTGRRHFRH